MQTDFGSQGARQGNTARRWFLRAFTALLCLSATLSLPAQVCTATVSGTD